MIFVTPDWPRSRPFPIDRPSVVLVTDCGTSIDDQFALIHLRALARNRLPGRRHRPCAEPRSARGRIVGEGGEGCPQQMDRAQRPSASHRRFVAGPISDPRGSNPGPAVDFLIAESRRHSADHRLAALVIGPMTDVAMALKVDPTFADRVEVIAMAFDDPDRGGDLWNVKNDVRAWQIVMRSRLPLVIGDDSATRKAAPVEPIGGSELVSRPGLRQLFPAGSTPTPRPREGDLRRRRRFPDLGRVVVVAHLLGLTHVESRPRPNLGGGHVLRPREVGGDGLVGHVDRSGPALGRPANEARGEALISGSSRSIPEPGGRRRPRKWPALSAPGRPVRSGVSK